MGRQDDRAVEDGGSIGPEHERLTASNPTTNPSLCSGDVIPG